MHREEAAVVGAEVDETLHGDRGGLDLPRSLHAPDRSPARAVERGDGARLRGDDDARAVDRRAGRELAADLPTPAHLSGLGLDRERVALDGVHVEGPVAVRPGELDVAAEPARPHRLLPREAELRVRAGERATRLAAELHPAHAVARRLRRRWRRGRPRALRDGDVVELGVERSRLPVEGEPEPDADPREREHERGDDRDGPFEGSGHERSAGRAGTGPVCQPLQIALRCPGGNSE